MKKIIYLIIFLSSSSLFAQSNDQIDRLLGEEKTTVSTASLLILVSAALIDENSDSQAAVNYINEKKWYKTEIKGDKVLTAGDASYLFMKAFSIKGGLMYKMVPGPRYAVREMKYLDILDKRTETGMVMSGEDFLVFLSEALSWKEENL